MGIGSGTAALIGGLASAGGSIASGVIGGNAAGNAAAAQSAAAQQNQQQLNQASQNALGYETNQYNTSQQNLSPWLNSGSAAQSQLNNLLGLSPQNGSPSFGTSSGSPAGATGSLGSMSGGFGQVSGGGPQLPSGTTPALSSTPQSGALGVTGSLNSVGSSLGGAQNTTQLPSATASPAGASSPAGGYGSLLSSYPGGAFQAPTAQQALNSPGEQAQLQLGETALQKSAAASGNALTGGEGMALENYAQNLASTNYQNTYNNALQGYNTNYGVWNNQQNNDYSRLMGVSSAGQNAATSANSAGQAAVNGISSNILGTAQNVAQQGTNAAAATASGIIGQANAYGGMAQGVGNSISNLSLLQSLYGGGSGVPNNTLGSTGYGTLNFDPAAGDNSNYYNWNLGG